MGHVHKHRLVASSGLPDDSSVSTANATDSGDGSSPETEGSSSADAPDVRAIPRGLVPVLHSLKYCTDAGRSERLRALGPGSRLVLRSLGLTTSDRKDAEIALTDYGRAVVEQIADESDRTGDGLNIARELSDTEVPRLRRIERIISVEGNQAAADAGVASATVAQYAVFAEGDALGTVPRQPLIRVAVFGKRLRVWQQAGPDDDVVPSLLVRETSQPLPRSDGQPLLVHNPDDEAPVALLKRLLVVGPPRGDGLSR